MTNILGQVTNGSPPVGQRTVIYSQEGMGKTTLMCTANRPFLIPMENGYTGINVAHTPLIKDWPSLLGLMEEIRAAAMAGKFIYKTLCFDGGTALDRIIDEQVIKDSPGYQAGNKSHITMESAHGGYGKAYALSNDRFSIITGYCDELATHAGISTIISCHAFAAKVVDPAFGEFSSWDILMHSPKNNKTYGRRELITQWADLVGFLHEPMIVTTNKDGGTRGISANAGRVLAVDRTPSWVAKNRYGLSGVLPIPKVSGWNTIANAIYANTGIDTFNRD